MFRAVSILACTLCALVPAGARPDDDASSAPHVVLIGGDAEYRSRETVDAMAAKLRETWGFRTTVVKSHVGSIENEEDPDTAIPGLEAIRDADLLVIYVRMRWPPREQLDMLDEYFASGKPAIGLRTTTHGFTNDRGWCPRYFGGHYWTHFGGRTDVYTLPAAEAHPVLRGLPRHRRLERNSLYVTVPLSDTATPLVLGRRDAVTPSQVYAWTNEFRPGQRLFFSTMSHPEDIADPYNQTLLYNAVFWCLGREVPEAGVVGGKEHARHWTRVRKSSPPPERSPPAGATVLFDGSDLAAWDWWFGGKEGQAVYELDGRAHSGEGLQPFEGARWQVDRGAVVAAPGRGDIITRASFTDYRLHLDFLVPEAPGDVERIWRGNSGVFLNGSYEVQILDRGGPLDALSCGAIAGAAPPARDAARGPGEWQSLDVTFRAPRFRGGRRVSPARVTVVLNGETVHENVSLEEETAWGLSEDRGENGPLAGPLRLQADSSPVRFANIWVVPLEEADAADLLPERRALTGKPWIDMDYGPFLTASLEVGKGNIAHKGIAVRLDEGAGGVSSGNEFVVFDTDTLRWAAAWIGPEFIDWRSIVFDGSHQTHPRIRGHRVFTNPIAPGWARPGSGSFTDERVRGRDGVAYGPLPRDWARWKGLYLDGGRVVLSYSVGGADVLEMPASRTFEELTAITRTLDIGPRPQDLVLQVAHDPEAAIELRPSGNGRSPEPRLAVFVKKAGKNAGAVEKTAGAAFDGATSIEIPRAEEFDLTGADFSIAARIRTEEGGTIFAKAPARGEWRPDGKTLFVRGGRLCYDIGWVGVVASRRRVDDGEWHDVLMSFDHGEGRVRLYVDGELEGERPLRPRGRARGQRVRIGYTSPDFPEQSGFIGEIAEVRFYRRRVEPAETRSEKGLVGRWDLAAARGGTVKDATGGRHRGRVVRVGAGDERSAFPLVFDGRVHLEVEGSDAFDLTGDDYSIYARVRTEGDGGTIFSKSPADGPWAEDSKSLFVAEGRLCFDIGWVGVASTEERIDDGEWHEVVMTWERDRGVVCFYLDGKEAAAIDDEEETDEDEHPRLKPAGPVEGHVVRIGYTRDDFPEESPSGFHGRMSEVRFYQRRLEPREIEEGGEELGEEGLVARWELESYESVEIEDATGNGHTARIAGAASLAGTRTVTVVALSGGPAGTEWLATADGHLRLRIPAGEARTRLEVVAGQVADPADTGELGALVAHLDAPHDLAPLTRGGRGRWGREVTTEARTMGAADGPFVVEELTVPSENPWRSWMRLGGFDFFDDGRRAAVCTWMGDVWTVDGIGGDAGTLAWRRIAAGLYQPLGLKIVGGVIHVLGRDQITRLHDLDGDGEADFYENFNNDAQATEHFHEFASGLETDAEGNFYYMKGGRHALDSVTPQHGSVIRVSRDGSRSEIVAYGFRAPNGICVNPDGSFIASDQEGHWTPANRINWIEPGGYYGYQWSGGYHANRPEDYTPPVCWIHPQMDRSPAEQLWVPRDRWGPLGGQLLSLSYGTGYVYLVLHEEVGGTRQGGVLKLPIEIFPTGIMRGRFHPGDGRLYLCGLFGWSSNRTAPGGFFRVASTGKPLHAPIELHATARGIVLGFAEPLDAARAARAGSYQIERWNYLRREQYGSKDYRLSDGREGRDRVTVSAVRVSGDGRTVFLEIPDMKPCMQMLIKYRLRGGDGSRLAQEIYSTIHVLGDADRFLDRF